MNCNLCQCKDICEFHRAMLIFKQHKQFVMRVIRCNHFTDIDGRCYFLNLSLSNVCTQCQLNNEQIFHYNILFDKLIFRDHYMTFLPDIQ